MSDEPAQGSLVSLEALPTDVPWQRLDSRMIGAALTRMLVMVAPVAFAWVILGQRDSSSSWTFVALTAVAVVVPCFYMLRYVRFRYRITVTELQITSGLLVRRVRRVPLHRIRTVDITAKPILRLFSLAIVTIGTGQQVAAGDSGLQLDAVRAPIAASLRADLLAAAGKAAERTESMAAVAGTDCNLTKTSPPTVLRIRWAWMLYAIVGVWSVAAPTVIFGSVYQGMQFLGRSPDTYVGWYFSEYLDRVSWGLWLLTTGGCFVVVGVIGAAAVFVESWWNYTLVHEQGGRFVATRGLLTTRSFTVDQSRLRGVTVAEALTTRALRGARLVPILTGVSADQQNKDSGVLVPTTTRDIPVSLANTLLGETVLTADRLAPGWLHRHPPAALRRILFRYQAAAVVLAAGLVAAWWWWDWPISLVAIPVVAGALLVPAALGNYRGLGHRVADGYLFSRRGYFLRRFDAVQLRGVSGAAVRQSVLQRRLGLASVIATTASGEKAYYVVDVGIDAATELASALGGREFVS
ncbi:putative membrane protein [Williamsia limnetica]|uniref:Putative membrane protein n=1 Tax=Williamsia limnetica TaxID=882452 RepID=A0A318S1K7_WILLI|nr:PH domain-containing protein [Williamsia limnetica]PYE20670.1 putative membrane protein [Williamsia limnetica]